MVLAQAAELVRVRPGHDEGAADGIADDGHEGHEDEVDDDFVDNDRRRQRW